jgi:predicted metallo-beta-lactamase superfamily hydrolase
MRISDCGVKKKGNGMNIIPLAAESLGVRSAAFFVETADVRVLIDPGVSLAPLRFGLPPHALEIKAMNESWRAIKEFAARADVIIITHYHFDHFDPTEPFVFNGKALLIKHPKENINANQRARARQLIKNFRTLPRSVEFADNGVFRFGGTVMRFSPAVPHGPGTEAGWVVEVSIREGESCFLHTSDIQGASLPQHVEFIRAENPDTLYLDGPLSYLMGQGFSQGDLRASIKNICDIIETTRVQTVIIDHHLLRDPKWKEDIKEVLARAKQTGKNVVTSAGFLGKDEEILEAHRRQLFAWNPDMPEEPIRRNRHFKLARELEK